jgi:radical SAM superfamily enzyme YgiQ (UPF0313 family)
MDLVMEPPEHLYRRVAGEEFHLVGFTSTPEARFSAIDTIQKVHSLSPASKIVTGGFFFTKTATDALKHVPEIYFVVRGEGEITLAELVKALSTDAQDVASVEGLTYRSNGEIITNPPRKPALRIDEFSIDYDLIRKPGYDLLFPLRNWRDQGDIRAFPLMMGRGCSQKCIFCMQNFLGYRVMKLETVIQTIDWAMASLGTRYFMFTDPSFSERHEFVTQFCNHLLENDYNIKWHCEGRADMPLDQLRLMGRAGCISIDFALESGSNPVLKTLRKRLTVEKVEAFARTCHELGIRMYFFTMISLPDEKPENARETLDIIRRLYQYGHIRTSIAPLIIFPGLEVETIAKERGLMPEGFSWFDRSYRCPYRFINPREGNMPHYLEHLTEQQVIEYLKEFRQFRQYVKYGKGPLVVFKKVAKNVRRLFSRRR